MGTASTKGQSPRVSNVFSLGLSSNSGSSRCLILDHNEIWSGFDTDWHGSVSHSEWWWPGRPGNHTERSQDADTWDGCRTQLWKGSLTLLLLLATNCTPAHKPAICRPSASEFTTMLLFFSLCLFVFCLFVQSHRAGIGCNLRTIISPVRNHSLRVVGGTWNNIISLDIRLCRSAVFCTKERLTSASVWTPLFLSPGYGSVSPSSSFNRYMNNTPVP